MIVVQIIFIISLLGICQTYIFYPLIMTAIGGSKKGSKGEKTNNELPSIEIIFAAYNEEQVIEKKIIKSFETNYPLNKLSLRVGTDKCSDRTDSIIEELQSKFPNLHHRPFKERTGKSGIINQLSQESKADILVLTDANILFEENTLHELVDEFNNPKVGLIGGNIQYEEHGSKGISEQEDSYLKLENRVKESESRNFGAAMGAEGGCYAIRRELFPVIPPKFFMEDFFVSLSVIEKGYQLKFNADAICYEDVSTDQREEFKRKVRISIGNFQNLNRFKGLVFKRFTPIGFAFLSHKILRWFTPFFLILLLFSSIILSSQNPVFLLFTGLYFVFLSAGLFGILFSQNKSVTWLKYPGHFLHMNLALLKGFFIYLKGVETNVWQPTSRNQN